MIKKALILVGVMYLLIFGFVFYQTLTVRKEYPPVRLTPWCGSYTPVAEMPLIEIEDLLEVDS